MPQQKGKLKIFRSSAGSGKTYTLAKEYLKLIFVFRELDTKSNSENYFRHVLAITFTNDAANEMKERVLQYLHEISLLKDDQSHPVLEDLLGEIKLEYPDFPLSKSDIVLLSDKVLKSILHRYTEFNIQTIDSFTNQISRAFSKELGLPANYEIYLDTASKLNEAVDMLIEQISDKEKTLMEWLFELVDKQIDDGISWNISFKIKNFAGNLSDENKQAFLRQLSDLSLDDFKSIQKELRKRLAVIANSYKNLSEAGLLYLDQNGIENQHLKRKSQGIRGFFEKNVKDPFSTYLNSYCLTFLNEGEWIDPKSASGISDIGRHNAQINALVVSMIDFYEKHNSERIVYKTVLENLYQLALLNKIGVLLDDLKKRDDQIFLSDLNEKIRDVILNEPIPFIYEKAGIRFKHLLIDEFQDTSLFQWINLIPLIANSVSEGYTSMIVGDAKQSIYGWRGGKPQILVDLPEFQGTVDNPNVLSHTLALKNNIETTELLSNWRSSAEIISFNNEFFKWIRENNNEFPGLGSFYEDIEQIARRTIDSDICIDVISTEGIKKADLIARKAPMVIEYINRCKNEGYTWSDMAIICRKNDEIYSLSEALIDAGISILSDESLLLKNAFSVKILNSVFEFIIDPSSEEKRFKLFLECSAHFGEKVDDWKVVGLKIRNSDRDSFLKFIIDHFKKEVDVKDLINGSVYQIAQSWIRCLDLSNDKSQQVYIDFFLDAIYDHSSRPESGIDKWMEYWEDKKDKLSISSSSEQNAVRIMSIHKSKGLEFPVVIVPFLEGSYSPRTDSKIWAEWSDKNADILPIVVLNNNKDLEATEFQVHYKKYKEECFLEELNSLYVAFTRAKKRLYVISSTFKGNSFNNYLNSYLETKAFDNEMLVWGEIEFSRFQITKETQKQVQKIEESSIPWDHSEFERNRIDRHLKWSFDSSLHPDILVALQKGKTFHYLMSQFRFLTDKSRIVDLAEKVLANREDFNLFSNFLKHLLDDSEISFCFQEGWEIFNERELYLNKNLHRPDRIQKKDDKIVIIDYKTGKEEEDHKIQVLAYRNALSQIFPNHEITSYLVYLEPYMALKVG